MAKEDEEGPACYGHQGKNDTSGELAQVQVEKNKENFRQGFLFFYLIFCFCVKNQVKMLESMFTVELSNF